MTTLLIGIVAIVALAYAFCLVQGMAAVSPQDGFTPEVGEIHRRFEDSPPAVLAAYQAGLRRTPGMKLIRSTDDTVLVDLRPTSRILGGNFGMVIRARFTADASGTRVSVDARRKAALAVFSNHRAALQHAERTWRMKAKASPITEIVVDKAS
jgi:hypothetical protein